MQIRAWFVGGLLALGACAEAEDIPGAAVDGGDAAGGSGGTGATGGTGGTGATGGSAGLDGGSDTGTGGTINDGTGPAEEWSDAIGHGCQGNAECRSFQGIPGAVCINGTCTLACSAHEDCGCSPGSTEATIAAGFCPAACVAGYCKHLCTSLGDCYGVGQPCAAQGSFSVCM